jgi:hypothetical protein
MTYLDKKSQTLWHCRFAPPKPGQYNIFIFAKEIDNPDQSSFSSAVQFAFDIDRLPLPTISYPLTWQKFFDYNLEIIKPMNSRYADWPSSRNNSYGEILIRSPTNICISVTLKDSIKGENVVNGTIANFNHDRKLWECLFAPTSVDIPFELILFAKQPMEPISQCVAQFDLRTISKGSLDQCMTFPMTYIPFNRFKCYLFEPLNGVLQKDSIVHFRCRIPGAQEVNMTVDGKWIQTNGLKSERNDDVFETDIHVGQKEVTVWVTFSHGKSSYEALLKYIVR